MGVSASSKNKDAAWEFVKYCSGEEGAKIYADCGMIPARMNADTIKALAALDGMPEGLEEALQTKHVAMDRPLEVHSAEEMCIRDSPLSKRQKTLLRYGR